VVTTQAPQPGSRQLPLGFLPGDGQALIIRESRRARRLAIRVHDCASVEVVVPRGTSGRHVRGFVERYREWIDASVARALAKRGPPQPFPPPRIDLPALQESWAVHVGGDTGRTRVATLGPGLLRLAGTGTGGERAQRDVLRRWLAAHALATFRPRLDALAAEFGFRFERLQVRAQRTRWGSCSTRGTITLNVALLFQAPEVLRYVMIHELAHLRHMNHSAAFWRVVASMDPAFRLHERALRDAWRHVPAWLRPARGEAAADADIA
jgi:predicted metal-dependent hydrolase